MKFAVFSVTLPQYTPAEAVELLSHTGHDGVEWRVVDQPSSDGGEPGFWSGNLCTWPLSSLIEDAPRIRKLCDDAGLEICNLGTYVTCAQIDQVELAMRGAKALGVSQLRVNPGHYDDKDGYLETRDRAREQYSQVAAAAQKFGVRALVEIHAGTITPSASSAAQFLDGLDPEHVGVIHDAGNMFLEGHENFRMGLEVLGPYLAHVHVKNGVWARDEESGEWKFRWASLDEGTVDLPGLFRQLNQIGYDGWISFEDFSNPRPDEAWLRRNLDYAKSLAAAAG